MADFYQEMAQMADELLAPTSQDGLGQGRIELIRKLPDIRNQAEPWSPISVPPQREVLRAVSIADKSGELIEEGSIVYGKVTIKSAVPKMTDWHLGSGGARLYISVDNGPERPVKEFKTIPDAGTPVVVFFTIYLPTRQ